MIQEQDLRNIREIVRLLDEAYQHWWDTAEDHHAKSAEGRVSIHLPTWWERRQVRARAGRRVNVTVYSYVLGPTRTHHFDDTEQALDAVRQWHAEEMSLDD